MKKIILLACFVTLIIFSARTVNACECAEPSGSSFREFEEAEAVFIGRVIEIKEVEVPSEVMPGSVYYQNAVKLVVEKSLKGTEGKEVIIYTGSRCCDCGFSFKKSEKYLVYASRYEGRLSTDYCTRTKTLATAAKDLKEIVSGQKRKKPEQVN